MVNQPVNIDWEKAWPEFWEKMVKNAPNTKEATDAVSYFYSRIWKEVKPFPGIEEAIEISVDKDHNLKTSMSGWVLLGSIAMAAVDVTFKHLDESPRFRELSKKVGDLEGELDELKAKVKRIQEYKEIA